MSGFKGLSAAQTTAVRTALLERAGRAGYRNEATRILDEVLPAPVDVSTAADAYVSSLERDAGESFKDRKRAAIHAAFLAGVQHATGEAPAASAPDDDDF